MPDLTPQLINRAVTESDGCVKSVSQGQCEVGGVYKGLCVEISVSLDYSLHRLVSVFPVPTHEHVRRFTGG